MGAGFVVGLMSGTSMDGVDAALCRFGPDGRWEGVHGFVQHPLPPGLRAELLALNGRHGNDELHRAQLAANAMAVLYGEAVRDLLARTGLSAHEVLVVGAHGQTVRHQPAQHDGHGYSVQLLQGALLAELTGIDVVCDLRVRDVAAGGQGAPLVPPFHAALFADPDEVRAVLNLGGIGNLTLLDPARPVCGFDCGPGNLLMDLWCERHLGAPYDEDGRWAESGHVLPALRAHLRREPFLQLPPPKSTGRDLFDAAWLASRLPQADGVAPQDVQATLLQFTVDAAVDALQAHAAGLHRLLVCGGGALNGALMRRLAAALPGVTVERTDRHGLPAMQVEAAAFAWLGWCRVHARPASDPAVTGARGARVLGAWHRA
jgi:anhydro-N-acetylmuramic acid kinase